MKGPTAARILTWPTHEKTSFLSDKSQTKEDKMKKPFLRHLNSKNVMTFCILLPALAIHSAAQTPQHYNYNSAGISNTIPFNQSAGYKSQWLIGPDEFNQRSPA